MFFFFCPVQRFVFWNPTSWGSFNLSFFQNCRAWVKFNIGKPLLSNVCCVNEKVASNQKSNQRIKIHTHAFIHNLLLQGQGLTFGSADWDFLSSSWHLLSKVFSFRFGIYIHNKETRTTIWTKNLSRFMYCLLSSFIVLFILEARAISLFLFIVLATCLYSGSNNIQPRNDHVQLYKTSGHWIGCFWKVPYRQVTKNASFKHLLSKLITDNCLRSGLCSELLGGNPQILRDPAWYKCIYLPGNLGSPGQSLVTLWSMVWSWAVW